MIERHGWKLFVLIGALGTFASLAMLVDPRIGLNMFSGMGPAVPAAFASDPFAPFLVRWLGTIMLGGNTITIIVAATAFRRGERWAGHAFLYWPAMFVSHLLLYHLGPMTLVQILWLSLTVPVLWVHYRREHGLKVAVATA